MGEVDSSTLLSIPPSDQNQVRDARIPGCSQHTGLGIVQGSGVSPEQGVVAPVTVPLAPGHS